MPGAVHTAPSALPPSCPNRLLSLKTLRAAPKPHRSPKRPPFSDLAHAYGRITGLGCGLAALCYADKSSLMRHYHYSAGRQPAVRSGGNAGRSTWRSPSARGWPRTPIARPGERRTVRSDPPARIRRHAPDPDLEGSRGAGGLPPLDRAPAGGGRARAVSRDQARASARPPTPASTTTFSATRRSRPRTSRRSRPRCGSCRRRTSPTSAS